MLRGKFNNWLQIKVVLRDQGEILLDIEIIMDDIFNPDMIGALGEKAGVIEGLFRWN